MTRVAYHEAGHVLLAHLLGGEVREVTIECGSDYDSEFESEHEDVELDGRTQIVWRGVPEADRRERSALVALAGPMAEAIWCGDDLLAEASAFGADAAEVEAALATLAPSGERDAVLHRWLREVAERLRNPPAWERLCRIADALEAHGTLDAALLAELMD